MNGSISTDQSAGEVGISAQEAVVKGGTDGAGVTQQAVADANQAEVGFEGGRHTGHDDDAPGEDDAGSEAETEITSPVKKREAQKQHAGSVAEKMAKTPRHRIGGLPVPSGDGDDDNDTPYSSVPSTVTSLERAPSTEGKRDRDEEPDARDSQSEALSSPRADGSLPPPSRPSSRSRAASEMVGIERTRTHSPNPRKRKHRASSVNLPNKRMSMGAPLRKSRDSNPDDFTGQLEQSLSPRLRGHHRRAASMQSPYLDGAADGAGKKRGSGTHALTREAKSARPGWEESDASSETTSHGPPESRRPQRGIGRSTSTPGRPNAREHKRHVNKYGFTRLAEACESGDVDLVREWREKDPDQIELAEFAGNKPLQIAALNGNVEVVDYLIDQGCQIDCANVDKDTPLIDAAENGHLDVVNSLLNAGVDPMRQNLKGQQALDVVTDSTDDADEIRAALRKAIEHWNTADARQRREEEEEQRHRAGPGKQLHLLARTYENLLMLVQGNNRAGVREFLDARVGVDNTILAAAAKTGDEYLFNMLSAEMPEKKAFQRAEKPMLAALGTSHYQMVECLTELEQFNPLYRNRAGRSWPELAEERKGPNWRKEKDLLQKLYDAAFLKKERRSSSPVTKRDSIKSRATKHTNADDSDEDESPKPKHSRRLMSRRAILDANGKAHSDASSEDSSSENATAVEADVEATMRPPKSPSSKRATPGPKAQGSAAQPPKEDYPRTRRRSSSVRGTAEIVLPTVEEHREEADVVMQDTTAQDQQAEDRARAAETKRMEEEEAARLVKAEADARRAEEARLAEAERKAEQARKEEEARKMEAARKVEEEQRRKELELEETKRAHREQVIKALPSAVAYTFDPNSSFDFDHPLATNYIAAHFLPLQVIEQDSGEILDSMAAERLWVINVQAAPLLGPRGLELMLRADVPGYDGSLADLWETKNVNLQASTFLESMLAYLPPNASHTYIGDDDTGDDDDPPFEQILERTAERVHAIADAKHRLRTGEAVLRYVRLDRVLANLYPKLQGLSIEVRFDYLQLPMSVANGKAPPGFVDRLSTTLDRRPRQRTYLQGQLLPSTAASALGTTRVKLVCQE